MLATAATNSPRPIDRANRRICISGVSRGTQLLILVHKLMHVKRKLLVAVRLQKFVGRTASPGNIRRKARSSRGCRPARRRRGGIETGGSRNLANARRDRLFGFVLGWLARGAAEKSSRHCASRAAGGALRGGPPHRAVFMRSSGECAFYIPLALRSQLQNAISSSTIVPYS
jgi:hypothetical protein